MKPCFSLLAFLLFVCLANAQTIVTGEYFLDTDPGFGNATPFPVTPAADGNFPLSVNIASASIGFHKLYIRTKNTDGHWSHTIRRDIEVLPSQLTPDIVYGEYYLDTDPGFGNGTSFPVTAAANGDFPLNVSIGTATIGFHKLYIRTKDNNGKWGHTVRKDIEVLPNMLIANVVAGEYFVDTDPGFGNATGFSVTASPDGIFPFSISVAAFAKGYHKLFIRTKDDNGKWGHTVRKDIEILEAAPPFVITGGEYFFDADPGIGNGIAFTFNPADTNVAKTFDLSIGCTDIAVTHQIYFRVKDNKGDWSATTANNFLAKDATAVTTVSNGLWSNPATWSNGVVPAAGTTVILNHNVTVDVNAACYLLRTNCKNLTVSAGKQLLITGP